MAAPGNSYHAKPVYIVDMRKCSQATIGQRFECEPSAKTSRASEIDLMRITSRVNSAKKSPQSGDITSSKHNVRNGPKIGNWNDKRPRTEISQSNGDQNVGVKKDHSIYVPPPLPPRVDGDSGRERSPLTRGRQLPCYGQAPRESNEELHRHENWGEQYQQINRDTPPKLPERTYERRLPQTPEPVPISRINVTEKDEIWKHELADNTEPVQKGLVPPLRHITPESTEELWKKYEIVDVLDTGSEQSDNSSADTMIMMTTEEEKKNEEKISRSTKTYESRKTTPQQNGINNSYGLKTQLTLNTNFVSPERSKPILGKYGNGFHSSPSSGSPEDENGTDEGYSTNTTVSSPLSSSWSSLLNSDLENSSNHGVFNKGVPSSLPTAPPSNGKSHSSVRTQWAVKRKGKSANLETPDNSLQERLRQLAIIEEEENTQINEELEYYANNCISENVILNSEKVTEKHEESSESFKHIIIDNDCEDSELSSLKDQFSPLLECLDKETIFEKFSDMDRNYRNYCGFEKESSDIIPESKINYFQDKILSQKYGHDNYYKPKYSGPNKTVVIEERDLNVIGCTNSLPRGTGMSKMFSVPNIHQISSPMTNGEIDPRILRRHGMNMESYGSRFTSNQLPPERTFSQLDSSNYNSVSPCQPMRTESEVIHNTSGLPTKGRFMSVDNLYRNCQRPTFATSKDIYKMFQNVGQNCPPTQRPSTSHRHSFHSGNVRNTSQNMVAAPRLRASSMSMTHRPNTSMSLMDMRNAGQENKNVQNISRSLANRKLPGNINGLSDIPLQTVRVEKEEGVRLTTLV